MKKVKTTPTTTPITPPTTTTVVQAETAAKKMPTINSLDELLEHEEHLHDVAHEQLDIAHGLFQLLSDELRVELADKARQVLTVVSPDLAEEVKEGKIFLYDKSAEYMDFAVCMGDDEEEDHNHNPVIHIPVNALLLEGTEWTQFVGQASFLNENGLVYMEADQYDGQAQSVESDDVEAGE